MARPPREADRCLCSPFSTARRAMRLGRGGVDGQGHAILAAAGKHFADRLPMPTLDPLIEPIADRCVGTLVGRTIAPTCAALNHVNDTDDDAAIVIASRTGLVRRQMRLYPSPLLVVKPEQSLTHRASPASHQVGAKESEFVNSVETLGVQELSPRPAAISAARSDRARRWPS